MADKKYSLKFKMSDGNVEEVEFTVPEGEKGPDGKSAYEYAKDGGYTGTEAEFAAKLAEEYPQPDWNAAEGEPGHVLNRPFYKGLCELVNGTAVGDDSSDGLVLDADIQFVAGQTYYVTYNGQNFTCIASFADGIVYVGNSEILGCENTGEPFFMGSTPEGFILYDLTGATEASVRIVAEQHTPIPIEYLENAFPYYVKVYAGTDDSGNTTTYSCEETVANLEAVFASGRNMVVRVGTIEEYAFGGYFYQLVQFFTEQVTMKKVFVFAEIGTLAMNKSGTRWLYLVPQEDDTYALSENYSS